MTRNKVLFWVLSVILLFHFSMKFIYQFTDYNKAGKFYTFSYNYIVPQFHFNYKVFAPEPPTAREHFLYRAILNDGSKTKWFEDGSGILFDAYQNRFSVIYKKWKMVNYLGFQTNKIYVELLKNPSIQHLGKDKVIEIANQQIIYYPQYINACRYANDTLVAKGVENFSAVQIAYLMDHVERPNESENSFEAQLFPIQKID